MEKVTKSYVEKIYRGLLFSDSSVVEVTERDPMQDKESKAKAMFGELREHIGEDVSYTGWWYGVKQEETAELREVNDFTDVVIGCSGIPFVGYGAAISDITSKDGEVLYSNPNIEYGYDRRSDEQIFASKRLIFGDKLVDEEKATISMMKKFEEGISFEDAEQQVYNEELGLSGFMAGATANALSHFAKQGDEYRKYWNKQYGIEDPEEKGTVNPAVLTRKKK